MIPAIVGQAMSSKWAKGSSGPAGDEHQNLIPVPFDTTQITSPHNYSAPAAGDACHPLAAGAHAPCIAFPEFLSGTQCASSENVAPALGALNPTAIAIQERADAALNSGPGGKGWRDDGAAYTLEARHRVQAIATQWAVRRLTPLECERLQGFPDGRTNVPHRGKPAADGPRYKALGNSWAVNCARWIGERIAAVDCIAATNTEAALDQAIRAGAKEPSDA